MRCVLQDHDSLANFCRDNLGNELQAQELAITGRNWGNVDLNGSSLVYKVDNKVMFEVPLPDVSQAQQTKVRITAAGQVAVWPLLCVDHLHCLAMQSGVLQQCKWAMACCVCMQRQFFLH